MIEITPKPVTTGPLVVAVVYDGLCTFEFAIAAEIFGLPRPELGPGWYRFASAAIEPGPLRADGGLRIETDGDDRLLASADIIIVPGWKGAGAPVPAAFADQLRGAWQRGARLVSLCSGAFALAATGLLDGRRAATHWRYADALAALHPAIDVDADVLYVAEDRLLTAAGSAAGIDLLLHIVRCDFGAAAANSVARRLVMPAHRSGGQAQFIEPAVLADDGSRMSAVIERVRADLSNDWTVAAMASAAAMSPRTFLRRFSDATGKPPGEWLALARIEAAKNLLEATELSVEDVATRCGVGSVGALRHHFRAKLGVSPREYRNLFSRHGLQGPAIDQAVPDRRTVAARPAAGSGPRAASATAI